MFSFLFLISPIGLPGLGTAGAGKKIAGITRVLYLFLKHIDYFLSFIAIILLIFIIIRIYKFYCKKRLKRIEILLYRFYSELLLIDESKVLSELEFSKKDTINLILDKINTKFFIKKIGKINQKRILVSFNLIKEEKLDINVALKLVDNWIKMVGWLVNNL